MEKPKRKFPGFFNSWDGTEEYLEKTEHKIPNGIVLSLQATFNQSPTGKVVDFFEYWLERQEYFSHRRNMRISQSAVWRLNWYNKSTENRKLVIGLVNVWATTYLLLKDYEQDYEQDNELLLLFRK